MRALLPHQRVILMRATPTSRAMRRVAFEPERPSCLSLFRLGVGGDLEKGSRDMVAVTGSGRLIAFRRVAISIYRQMPDFLSAHATTDSLSRVANMRVGGISCSSAKVVLDFEDCTEVSAGRVKLLTLLEFECCQASVFLVHGQDMAVMSRGEVAEFLLMTMSGKRGVDASCRDLLLRQ